MTLCSELVNLLRYMYTPAVHATTQPARAQTFASSMTRSLGAVVLPAMVWLQVPFFTRCAGLRQVKWSVQTSKSVAATPTFTRWFADDANPVKEAIVAANDAISDTKDLGEGRFEARVKSAKFPLVQLEPVMTSIRRP